MHVDQALRQRRAINFFDPDRPVEPALLDRLIELAALAPSSFNLQPWNLIILTDPAEKMKLRKLAMDQPKVSEAPVVLMFLADRQAWQKDRAAPLHILEEMQEAGAPQAQQDWFVKACQDLYGGSDEASQAFACKNAGFLGMAVMLAAKHLGLETHPMDGFDHQGVRQAFDIPDRYWVAFLMAVGYFAPGKKLHPPKWRKEVGEIVLRRL